MPTNGFPWDAYHINSMELTGAGTFLVSMRNTWAAYLVDIASGRIEWTLGGKHSSFKFGPGAAFQWQHDVAASAAGGRRPSRCSTTTAARSPAAAPPSRRPAPRAGWCSELDQRAHTATLVAQYPSGGEFEAEYMGDPQPLADGNVFVGWGSEPYFSEFSPLRAATAGGRSSPART